MELTKAQISYIAAVDALKAVGATQSAISSFLNVTRPTANVAIKALISKGYIEILYKDKSIEYGLTEKGNKIIEKIEYEKSIFLKLFKDHLGIDETMAENEYIKISGLFGSEFLKVLHTLSLNDFKKEPLKNISSQNENFLFKHLPSGTYSVPFQVRKLGDTSPSMGNRGFVHPAEIIINNSKSELLLTAKTMYHKSSEGFHLKGSLVNLSYFDLTRWIRAEVRMENVFVIPLRYIMYQNNNQGKPEYGQIKIKAESSSKHMPVSIAEITFNFSLMNKI